MRVSTHMLSYALFFFFFSQFSRFVDGSPNPVLVNARHEATAVQVPFSLSHR